MPNILTLIQFEKTSDIGNNEGKNSNVFIANDLQLGSTLVIKRMEKSKFKPEEYFSESKMIYDSKHPNVAEIQYASQDNDNIYLAMPYYRNGSLNTLCNNRFLTVREIVKYSLDLLSAVSFIHSKNMLHLDIKPTNILIDDTGKAILTDFGLSKYMDGNGVAEQPYNYRMHVDPEWYQSSGRTIQSDIYQIGLTMYRLCNGIGVLNSQLSDQKITTPDQLKDAILKGKFPDRKLFFPHVPKQLQKIILKALQINPDSRYMNTIEMMNDISSVDSNLDWQFTGDLSTPYVKSDETYEYCICVKTKNTIECVKTNIATKKTTKMSKYCMKYTDNGKDLFVKLASIVGGIS